MVQFSSPLNQQEIIFFMAVGHKTPRRSFAIWRNKSQLLHQLVLKNWLVWRMRSSTPLRSAPEGKINIFTYFCFQVDGAYYLQTKDRLPPWFVMILLSRKNAFCILVLMLLFWCVHYVVISVVLRYLLQALWGRPISDHHEQTIISYEFKGEENDDTIFFKCSLLLLYNYLII